MIKRINSNKRMSQVVIHDQTVYLAGQVADDPHTPVQVQTSEILAKIDSLLASAGTDRSKILSATVWLADIRTFDEMNKAWDAWVSSGNEPARATVESRLASPIHLVEIMVIAAR
jgi:enamine deaminase RidA (YjgF/YER057c/UK114 family)